MRSSLFFSGLFSQILVPTHVLLVVLLSAVGPLSAQPSSGANRYDLGQQYYASGDITAATDTWLQEWNRFSADSSYAIDPRCGVAFMRAVTEHSMSFADKLASAYYLASLTSPKMAVYASALNDDWYCTMVLANEQEQAIWKNLSQEWTPERGRQAVQFWESLGSNPETKHNESLLLFYQRVAMVNRQFPEVSLEDGRVQALLKYGPPMFTKVGSYETNWTSLNLTMAEHIGGEALLQYTRYIRTFMDGFSINYEIWTYESTEMVLFENRDLVFRESTISDLLPVKAKIRPRSVDFNNQIIPFIPAFFILYDVSKHLATKSDTYARNFTEVIHQYEQSFTSGGGKQNGFSTEVSNITSSEVEELSRKRITRPTENLSQQKLIDIQNSVTPYFFVRPETQETIAEYHILSKYEILDGLRLSSMSISPSAVSLSSKLVPLGGNPTDQRTIASPNHGERAYFTILSATTPSSEERQPSLLNLHSSAEVAMSESDSLFDARSLLLGSSKQELSIQHTELSETKYRFSEIIVGSPSQNTVSELYTFTPSPGKTVKQGSNLAFYLEIYAPTQVEAKNTEIQLKVTTRSDRLLRFLDAKAKQSIVLRIPVNAQWHPVELEYETNDFPEGKYELVFELLGQDQKRLLQKTKVFEVVAAD